MLNIDTFKNMCMLVKTEKSKQIRKYYVKLENIYNKIIKEEIESKQNELEGCQKQLEDTQQQLKKERTHKNQILRRKYYDMKPGDVVYLYKDNTANVNINIDIDKQNKTLFKIGKSKNISEREKVYSNLSKNGSMVYVKRCLKCHLTESLIHHMFDKYRINSTQEWFDLPSEDLAIQLIDTIVYIIDSQIESIDAFIPNLYQLLDINTNNNTENKTEVKNTQVKHETDELKKTLNPMDFERFINECCEVGPDFKYPKSDIKQAHRVWGKSSTKNVIKALDNYLNNKFESGVILKDDIKRNVYKGVKLKPLTYVPKNDIPLDYEEFIYKECQINWCHRISYADFFTYFIKWKQIKEPNYTLNCNYKKEIQTYLETVFAGGRVHLSEECKSTHLFGVWGLGMSFNNFGTKVPKRTCKKVCQYNANTNELINSWDSLSIASRELGIATSSLSNYCRFNNVINNIVYKYLDQ